MSTIKTDKIIPIGLTLTVEGSAVFTAGISANSTMSVGGVAVFGAGISANSTMSVGGVAVFGAGISANSTMSVGATLSASSFVGNGTIPIGGIIMWSGTVANIPTGWELCNGLNGTPDLRSRFVVGASAGTGAGGYAVGASGGSATASLVDHRHLYAMDDNAPGISIIDNYEGATISGGGAAGGGSLVRYNTSKPKKNTGAAYSEADVTVVPEINTANLPPYYALAFIMRTT